MDETTATDRTTDSPEWVPAMAWVPVGAAAVGFCAVLLALSTRYGYHRDELYFRVAGRHLAWGYVDQPPWTPLLARIGVDLFGDTVIGLRVLPAVIAGIIVVTAGLLARELGATRGAQVLAAGAVGSTTMVLQVGHMLSTPTTDIAIWLAIAVVFARMLRTGQSRWWVAVGLMAGLGALNKFTVFLLVATLVIGVMIVGPRDVLRSWWVAVGAILAVLIISPTLGWQAAQGFPQFAVASSIADDATTNRILFFPMQILIVGPLLAPMWVVGLLALWRDPGLRRFRAFGVAYPVAAVAVIIGAGKFYYVFGLLAVLLVTGAAPTLRWLRRGGARLVMASAAVVITLITNALIGLPLLPATAIGVVNAADKEQGEQIGWQSFAATVDGVWHQIPESSRPTAVVYSDNYGEAGALDRYATDLMPYSGHMSFANWGPPSDRETGPVVVVDGGHPHRAPAYFTDCRHAARIDSGVDNDEQGTGVWLCTGPHRPWSVLWPHLRRT
ncbi:ArnT family glycosyltransferase [Williamsia sterculiae]|uniref:Dolichyl-phosphate-mannose-protein mannosyltransferase n=1 Tax=Williamsia sterculiae TaxID=1344003 RepID=A0A1N7H1N9_9NOCA|nr:glycosyltransferase family 39 protein [Williamsia sterculiae]SIS18752.1 Dolichyl-phosphate-mannose-protein mannosyltransferase [Williamsia sterculiae]